MKLTLFLFLALLTLGLVACAPSGASDQAAATSTPSTLAAAVTNTMPMSGTMPVDHAAHHPDMGASAAMTHTMPLAGGMDHAQHMALMMQDMEGMMQRMVEMHASMPMTGTMDMQAMTNEQHMGRMMIMMGQMMQMMGEMHVMGGTSGMDHGAMGGGMCDKMGGQGCEMMGSMGDMSGMDHGAMGGGMCDMMGGQGCGMMGAMGASSPVTATQGMTGTAPGAAAALGAPDIRTSDAGGRAVTVTPLNLSDPQAATLDFALSWQDQAADADLDVAALATLRAGTTQLAATGWQPDSGVLSFPATDLGGVNTVTLVLRNVAGAPMRTFTWALRQ